MPDRTAVREKSQIWRRLTWGGDVGEKECVDDSLCDGGIGVGQMEFAKHDGRRSLVADDCLLGGVRCESGLGVGLIV